MRKVLKVLSVAVAPIVAICTFLAGCVNILSKPVSINNGVEMRDIDVPPEENAAYEQYTKQALEEYRAVALSHTDEEGETDLENEDVINSAKITSAKLFAYACYNERTLNKYVFFSDQEANTDLGKSGSAEARRQEYYLRVNESENSCGYRYHYTIKKVIKSSGNVSLAKSLFESARIRMTDKTNLLYRFEGDASTLKVSEAVHETLGCNMLECDWATGSDWGKPDIEMKKSDFIAPDQIENDIVMNAGEDNITMRGNINILAENMVKYAMIIDDGEGGVVVRMNIDTDVANSDEASLKMLRKANSSDDCRWVSDDASDDTGLAIVFRIWANGLFRFYSITERWGGKINGFSGTADSSTTYYYSYSDADCNMAGHLEMLEEAKALLG